MTEREWNTAVATGLLRIAVGTVLFRWRTPLAHRLAGAASDDPLVPALFGYFGLRDIAVGVITLASTRPGSDVAARVRLQGHADASDAVVVAAVTKSGRIPRDRGLVAIGVAVGSAAAEYVGARALRRSVQDGSRHIR